MLHAFRKVYNPIPSLCCRAMSSNTPTIVYTHTDEAPALATYALLPVIRRFTETAGIKVEKVDISVAGRILSQFPERLSDDQRVPDNLSQLGEQCRAGTANIIKLPNVSASIPQLEEAIAELQSQGYNVPNYVANPTSDEDRENKARYASVLGSAVNPVLREGNSDRRVALPVKTYAQNNPKRMGDWTKSSKTHIASMKDGDFYSSEQSHVMESAGNVCIEHISSDGTVTTLKSKTALLDGEVIDASCMNVSSLKTYLEDEMKDAKNNNLMLSLHMKATMMKVSDPIIFGHCVSVFYKDALEKHASKLESLGVNTDNGIGDVYQKIASLPDSERKAIEADLNAVYNSRPGLAMVNSHKGITNLHVPSDVIVDASMPVVIRDSGCMWNKDDALEDTKCLIPDRSYAGIFQETIDYCKENGQFDPSTMGSVANVGLMAQKAQEYGSHTFKITSPGKVVVKDDSGNVLMQHDVGSGDIWRMCQTKDIPIKDWVGLAVRRSRASGDPAIFWLDSNRSHDRAITKKVERYLSEHDLSGVDVSIMQPRDAIRHSMERASAGKNTMFVFIINFSFFYL